MTEIILSQSILFLDDNLVVVNKPSGISCIREGYDSSLPNLYDQLAEKLGKIWIVHRLDKQTSGAIIFCRTSESHQALNTQFQDRKVSKTYHALVGGSLNWYCSFIQLPLKVDGDRSHRTVIDYSKSKPASTRLSVKNTFRNISLLEAIPYTGYTHQIRCHLSAIKHPILGDTIYHFQKDHDIAHSRISRLALHAYSISFLHPVSKQLMKIIAPYPEDFLRIAPDIFKYSKD